MNNVSMIQKLAHEFDAQLDQLVQANHCGAGMLTAERCHVQLSARILRVEHLACEVETMRIAWSPDGPARNLVEIASRLANNVTYLEEDLIVLEQDDAQVQLRSQHPFQESETKAYFEAVIGPGEISICRYCKSPGERRTVVPMVMTRKLLKRLGNDLFSLVGAD